MKLIIQIPCFNEVGTLEATYNGLPTAIEGIDTLETLVIDDGSTDGTVALAEKLGIDHIISLPTNRGLAQAFKTGITYCLTQKADIIVNTDGDNQYLGADIRKLVKPILSNVADLVVGCRPILNHPEFSFSKKILQVAGSWVLRVISGVSIRDAASGFRAYSRNACLRLNVYSRFSYCMETLIQAGNIGLQVCSVDIDVNAKTRESRLFSTVFEYLFRSTMTIIQMFLIYRPALFFTSIGSAFYAGATILGIRFLLLTYYLSSSESTRTYLPSLILLSIFVTLGSFSFISAIFGHLHTAHRVLLEEVLYNQRVDQFDKKAD